MMCADAGTVPVILTVAAGISRRQQWAFLPAAFFACLFSNNINKVMPATRTAGAAATATSAITNTNTAEL